MSIWNSPYYPMPIGKKKAKLRKQIRQNIKNRKNKKNKVMTQQQKQALERLGYVKKQPVEKLEQVERIEPEAAKFIATEYKGYFTKWDKTFLTGIFNEGIHTSKQKYLFEVILSAVKKRKEENNSVIDLTDEQIEIIENNKHYFDVKQKEYYETIKTKFHYSYTTKMKFMIDSLISAHIKKQQINYFD